MVNIVKISSKLSTVIAQSKSYTEGALCFGSPHRIPTYIAVTVAGITSQSQKQAMRAAESCLWATNIPTFVVSPHSLTRFPECARPTHLKLRIFDLFPEARTIVYFSSNLLFREKIDLLEYEHTSTIMFARSIPSRGSLCDMILNRIPFNDYFATDLFVVSRERHEKLLTTARTLRDQRDRKNFDEGTLLNRARVALSLPTQCFLPITSYPIDNHYHAPLDSARLIKLEAVPNTYKLVDDSFYGVISPAFGTGKLGRLDRRHLARNIVPTI